MKITKKALYSLPDIIGEQLSPKKHAEKMKQLDKDMKIAIARHKVIQKKKNTLSKKAIPQ